MSAELLAYGLLGFVIGFTVWLAVSQGTGVALDIAALRRQARDRAERESWETITPPTADEVALAYHLLNQRCLA
jgi:hypothetical protein